MKKLLLLLLILSVSLVPSFVFATQEYSASFNSSSSQYLSITDDNQTGLDLNTTNELTFEFWMKRNYDENLYFIITKDITPNQRQYGLYLSGGQLNVNYHSTDANYTHKYNNTDINTINDDGEWHHYAITINLLTYDYLYYKDGQPFTTTLTTVFTNASSIQNDTAPFRIGQRDNNWYLNAQLDEVRVWSDIRTAQEIEDNYNTTLVGNETNLVGYWKMENNFVDETSNNNDLTNNNSVTFSTDVPFTLTPEPEPTPTSTLEFSFVPDDLDYIDDIGVVVGLTYHYETSTTTADWYEKHYFRWIGIYMILFIFLFFMIANRLLLELIIRWRK